MAISSISSAAPATGLGRASGSRDNTLIDIVKMLTDESGLVSDEEKLAAQKKLGDLAQATDASHPYGFAGYSTEDIKHLEKLNANTSSFLRKQNTIVEKYSRFADELVRAGKSGSATVQMQIDFLDQMSPFEKTTLGMDGDYRDTLAALKKVFQKLEERAAAGAYKMGTPIDQTSDPEARAALYLLEAVQDRDPVARARARAQVDDMKIGGFGVILDTVDLSATAKASLGQA